MRILGEWRRRLHYIIHRRQLEEADLIVVNKRELLAPDELSRLRDALQREFPAAQILAELEALDRDDDRNSKKKSKHD